MDDRKGQAEKDFNERVKKEYPGNKLHTGKYWEKSARDRREGKASKELTGKRIEALKRERAKNERMYEQRNREARAVYEKPEPAPRPKGVNVDRHNEKKKGLNANVQKRLEDHKRAERRAHHSYAVTSREFNKEAGSRTAKFNQKSKGIER